jgi:RNA-directed DNA polymerase
MDDRRQKNQLVLAFMEEDRGEAPKDLQEGTESSAGKRGTESPAIAEQLMEEVCGRENCKQALKRVKANKGSAGVDGMTVQQLPEYLKQHWPAIREQLLSGTYKPQAVRRVEIPKPDGGVRKLGIPTVLDRFNWLLCPKLPPGERPWRQQKARLAGLHDVLHVDNSIVMS